MSLPNGLESIKTATSYNLHSIPNSQRSRYLSLFMLNNRKKRLKKDCSRMKKKLKIKSEEIKEIEKKIKNLERKESVENKKSLGVGKNIKNPGNVNNAQNETMQLGY